MRTTLLATVIASASLFGQAAKTFEFEVASIRPAEDINSGKVNIGIRMDGAQMHLTQFSLKDDLGMAFDMKPVQIIGPDFIDTQRFNISATLPPGATRNNLGEMMAALLRERFELKSHREKKEFPVYVLEVGKGGMKLKALAEEAETDRGITAGGSGSEKGVNVNLGNGSSYAFGNNKFEAKKVTMQMIAGILERFADRPIVDQTGIKGNYDVTIDLTEEDYRGMLIRSAINAGVTLPPQALKALESASMTSIIAGFEKVGLKLEARKAPLDVMVVDSIRKTPTEN